MDKKKLTILAVLPLLAGCSSSGGQELEIPSIDVENIVLNLPPKPEFNKGEIKTDGTYDYIDIYETSDFHGAVNCEVDDDEVKIGLTRLSQFLLNKREENKGGTVLISGGDMWQGSADSNLTHGYVVTHSMNYMGFDTMTLGNHEFDWTDSWIRKNKGISDFEYLCANLQTKDTKTLPDFVKRSKIIERGPYKIGIIGTIGKVEYSIIPSAIANYEFLNDATEAAKEAKHLKDDEHCDVVIWSDHFNAEQMNKQVPGVDVYFGGHEHVSYDNNSVPPCLATRDYGVEIAHVGLKIDKSTKQVLCDTENTGLIDFAKEGISLGYAEDDNVKSIVNQYAAETNKVKAIEIGSTNKKLRLDNELANICVKSITQAANKYSQSNNLGYDVMAGFHNKKGGVRADIEAGPIKYGDVYTSFPFDNQIVIVPIDGKDVQTKFNSTDMNSLAIYHTFESFKDFEKGKIYYFCTTDYIAQSRLKLKENEYVSTYMFVRDVVAQAIKNHGNVNADEFDRMSHSEYRLPVF